MRTVIAAPDPPAMIESNDQYYGEQYSNEGGSRDGDEEIVENEDEEELTESEVEIEFEYGDEVLYEEEEQVDGGSRVTREGTENVGQDNKVPQSQVANYEETAEPYEDYREHVDDQPWRETVEQSRLGNDAEEGQYDQDYMEYERWDEDVAGNNDQRQRDASVENVEQSRAVGNDRWDKDVAGNNDQRQHDASVEIPENVEQACAVGNDHLFFLLSGFVGVILVLVLQSDDSPAVRDTTVTQMPCISRYWCFLLLGLVGVILFLVLRSGGSPSFKSLKKTRFFSVISLSLKYKEDPHWFIMGSRQEWCEFEWDSLDWSTKFLKLCMHFCSHDSNFIFKFRD